MFIILSECTKVAGLTTNVKAEDMKDLAMEMCIKDPMKRDS